MLDSGAAAMIPQLWICVGGAYAHGARVQGDTVEDEEGEPVLNSEEDPRLDRDVVMLLRG